MPLGGGERVPTRHSRQTLLLLGRFLPHERYFPPQQPAQMDQQQSSSRGEAFWRCRTLPPAPRSALSLSSRIGDHGVGSAVLSRVSLPFPKERLGTCRIQAVPGKEARHEANPSDAEKRKKQNHGSEISSHPPSPPAISLQQPASHSGMPPAAGQTHERPMAHAHLKAVNAERPPPNAHHTCSIRYPSSRQD